MFKKISVLLITNSAIIILLLTILKRGYIMWYELLISIAVGLITSFLLTIFMYYKYLKKIPEKTEDKINNLLNQRLSYESSNHNSLINAIQNGTEARKSGLSLEHKDIKDILVRDFSETKQSIFNIDSMIKTDKEVNNLKYQHLSIDQKTIIDNLNNLKNIGEHLKQSNYENQKLKQDISSKQEQIKSLQDRNLILEKTLNKLTENYHYEYKTKKDFGRER
ncbi:MAG: hypothetical protein KFW09_04870 [Oscillospiraceae bacterium]|nr:hypothetical protein [Oscillospiraceae bacterium]